MVGLTISGTGFRVTGGELFLYTSDWSGLEFEDVYEDWMEGLKVGTGEGLLGFEGVKEDWREGEFEDW